MIISFYHLNVHRSIHGSIQKDGSYGVHRGLDLHGVKSVINYDMPETEKSYIHRYGSAVYFILA